MRGACVGRVHVWVWGRVHMCVRGRVLCVQAMCGLCACPGALTPSPLALASSCDQEQQSALEEARQPRNDNVVIPECAHGGLYKPVQCHPSTGYCWCVLVDTGRPIPGTSTR